VALVNAYTTTEIVTEEVGRKDTDSTRADSIERAIYAASRQIDRYTGRPHGFWQDDTVVIRYYAAEDATCVEVDDISTATGLIVKTDVNGLGSFSTTLTITTDFKLLPLNAVADGRPFDRLVLAGSSSAYFPVHSSGTPGVQVTAKFGWAAIPSDVAEACVIQAVSLYKAPAASMGILQVGVDGIPARVPYMHPIAAALLEGYCKPRVG
jgi:hypothetical protein